MVNGWTNPHSSLSTPRECISNHPRFDRDEVFSSVSWWFGRPEPFRTFKEGLKMGGCGKDSIKFVIDIIAEGALHSCFASDSQSYNHDVVYRRSLNDLSDR